MRPIGRFAGMKPNGTGGETGVNYQWWTSEDPGSDMVKTARKVAEKSSFIREQMLWHARMHGGVEIAGLTPTAYSRPSITVSVGEGIGLNVIENMCSAAQAEICQNKPKASFTTDGGDWETRQKAEKLDRFCEGQFYAVKMYDLAPKVFLDACIFGTGAVKIYEDEQTEKIVVERVFPWELLIDQADGLYGSPMCLYHTKYVDRTALKQAYPGHDQKLTNVHSNPLGIGRDPFMYDTTADLVQVVEGWRLPTATTPQDGEGEASPDPDVSVTYADGRKTESKTAPARKPEAGLHIVAVDGVTLLEEEWTLPDFPFAFIRWLDRPFGFWGKGLTEQLAGIQKEINRLLIKIQRAFAKLGITRVFLERGSKVNPAHLRSNDGDIIEYTGTPPTTVATSPVSEQIFGHLWKLEGKAYDITGISQMTAQGQAPPPGVDSGRAIRALLQNHSKRMSVVADAYTEFFMAIGRKMIALARDIALREAQGDADDAEAGKKKTARKGYKVRYATEAGTQTIDFADIDLAEDQYIMRPYPTSALPSNPGEKMQVVQEWFNTGMIDADKAMMLMDFPDTKQFADMNPAIALYKAVMRKLTGITKEGKPWVPDSFIDPPRAKALAIPFLLNAEEDNVPSDRLDLLRQCIEDLVALERPPPANRNGGEQPNGAPPPGGGQLPGPDLGPQQAQVAPIGPMANPMQPKAA